MFRYICVLFLVLTGCASNVITYVPPSHQAIPRELYTVELPLSEKDAYDKIVDAMSKFLYLTRQNGQLIYKGTNGNANEFVDCGQISANYVGSPSENIPYANPKSQFIGFENNSSDKLSTNLDLVISFTLSQTKTGTRINVDVQYTLNRHHIERYTAFGIEKISPEKNSPINFSTLIYESTPDGITCKSKLILEYEIISKLEELI